MKRGEKQMKIGNMIYINGFLFMRVNKNTAKKAYYLNKSIEIVPQKLTSNFQPYQDITKDIFTTVNKKECMDNTFENAMVSYDYILMSTLNKKKSDPIEYYIPVKLVDRFTGEKPTRDTLPDNHIFVYDNAAYTTLKPIW